MSEYDFILEGMVYSYSSVSNFVNCPYAFYLTYIDYVDRSTNWYSDFGLYIHNIMEKFFADELDVFDLPIYFEENYESKVTAPLPMYPVGIEAKYREQTLEFFNNFSFDKSQYDVIDIETFINVEHEGINITIRPDLILRDKNTSEIILVDYKTSDPYNKKTGKPVKKKIEEYKKQMLLYSYFINKTMSVNIDKIKLWFVRVNKIEEFDYSEKEAVEVLEWFTGEIKKIKEEEEFPPTDTTKNKFFCLNLCSVSEYCKFKP